MIPRKEGQKQKRKELTQETPEPTEDYEKKRSDSIGTDATMKLDTSH